MENQRSDEPKREAALLAYAQTARNLAGKCSHEASEAATLPVTAPEGMQALHLGSALAAHECLTIVLDRMKAIIIDGVTC